MKTPANTFKQAMKAGELRIGLWLGLASPYAAEICAGAGFDWMLVDGEHSPNNVTTILEHLQVAAAYPDVNIIARVPIGHGHIGEALIKQYLDVGVQTLLVPMVDTAEQAAAIVRAARYPQADGKGGIRGVGGARAARWGRFPRYVHEANEQICILVQVETRVALNNLDAILAVEGVDGVFIGPADLAASLGQIGNPAHPNVQDAIADAIARIKVEGKAAGILTPDEALASRYIELGATFVAVGIDTNLLVKATTALASKFKPKTPSPETGKN